MPVECDLPANLFVPRSSLARFPFGPETREMKTKPVRQDDRQVSFITKPTAGSYQHAPVFVDAEGNEVGADYTVVTKEP